MVGSTLPTAEQPPDKYDKPYMQRLISLINLTLKSIQPLLFGIFTNPTVTGGTITGSALSNATLTGTTAITGGTFTGSAISNATLTGTTSITGGSLVGPAISNAAISGSTTVSGGVLNNSSLSSPTITSATINSPTISNSTLSGTVAVSAPASMTFGSGWISWTPVVTGNGSMTTSGASGSAEYIRIGPLVYYQIQYSVTLGGTLSNAVFFSLPVSSSAQSMISPAAGTISSPTYTFNPAMMYVDSSTRVSCFYNGGTNYTAASYSFYAAGFYRCV